MFEVIELGGKGIAELKEIAKSFSLDSKNLAKGDLILKIVDAQMANPELAKQVVETIKKKINN